MAYFTEKLVKKMLHFVDRRLVLLIALPEQLERIPKRPLGVELVPLLQENLPEQLERVRGLNLLVG
jgi:hypothetical protein